jgi:hypothetical protein
MRGTMSPRALLVVSAAGFLATLTAVAGSVPQAPASSPIPRTWDDAEVHAFEMPLAQPEYSPKHVPSEYYYSVPVRPIYRSYPIYHPAKEPAGYLDELRAKAPEVVFEEARLERSEAEWRAHGEFVFDAPISYGGPIVSMQDVRSEAWYRDLNIRLMPDGIMPYARYVVREKGRVEVGNLACAMCHTRVLPDGTVVKGAQGNFAFDPAVARGFAKAPDEVVKDLAHVLTFTPWNGGAAESLKRISGREVVALFARVPDGTLIRQGTSLEFPARIPDLIGIRDRKYLDATGFVRHRGPGDIMRYAAANQTFDMLATYGGWMPAGIEQARLPPPGQGPFAGTADRYSDVQLYALAQYLYAIEPPPNPNRFDEVAAQGQQLFERERCGRCHTPPLYTNNRLIPVRGFRPPAEHYRLYDIMDATIDTDPTLTLQTRRGTGYYKIPSLKGLWYRGPLEHNGAAATLEEWFDPARIEDDYRGSAGRPVRGHPWNLVFTPEERAAVIAFLRTL